MVSISDCESVLSHSSRRTNDAVESCSTDFGLSDIASDLEDFDLQPNGLAFQKKTASKQPKNPWDAELNEKWKITCQEFIEWLSSNLPKRKWPDHVINTPDNAKVKDNKSKFCKCVINKVFIIIIIENRDLTF